MSFPLCLRATHSSRSSDSAGAARRAGLAITEHQADDFDEPEMFDTVSPKTKTNADSSSLTSSALVPVDIEHRALRKRARFVLDAGDNGSVSQSESEGQKYLLELWSEGHPSLLPSPPSLVSSS